MNELVTHPLGEDLELCTGCAACAAICPSASIVMQSNAEGFLYPQINSDLCDNCDRCRNICPVNPKNLSAKQDNRQNKKPSAVFATWHLNEVIRHESSSGGVFTALAESLLLQGGVVAGAAFDDNFVVRHILIENSDDLEKLRGSKYVQSEVPPSMYQFIRDSLTQGRIVLFSGTPCQVAGLRNYLRKPYDNLFCCDIVCHGVPSPKVFDVYKKMLERQYGARARRICFRRKDCGWKRYSVSLSFENNTEYRQVFSSDPYMLGFLKNIYLRESCYTCIFTNIERPGDLSIADFWQVADKYPDYDSDDKGTSLILVNTGKGRLWLKKCSKNLFIGPADLDTAIIGNPILVKPSNRPPEREIFYRDIERLSFADLKSKYALYTPMLYRRILGKIKKRLKEIICRSFLRYQF